MENKVVTSKEMKEIERLADMAGVSYYQMMENAGTAASEFIDGTEQVQGKKVLIFCGKGNNGGDGIVVARKLLQKGAGVKIVLADGEPKTQDAIKNMEIYKGLDLPAIYIEEDWQASEASAKEADIIVDAIYGTGFHGNLNELVRKANILINDSGATVFALDIPSGLNSDNGEADRDTVMADYTIVFHRFKPAHVMDHARRYLGKLICVDIGIKEEIGKRD